TSNSGGWGCSDLVLSARMVGAVVFLAESVGKVVEFYHKILVNQGALGSLPAARDGEAYKATDDYFGGQPVWQNFSDWLAAVPSVNYGIFTNEVDAAIVAQLPGIAQGASVDDAIAAIDAQVQQQIQ